MKDLPPVTEIKQMFFGILTMLVALAISSIAIYYSVAGLVAIFAAATIPIIIMGGALEVGKLVTAVWLHRYWGKARWWMRLYLGTAVAVLMFITSMGIFGFLSKAHIEQTAAAQEQVAILARYDVEIERQQDLITRAEERIVKAEEDAAAQDVGIQDKIDREQERINNAYSRRQPSIDEQQQIITAQQVLVDSRVAVYEDEIQSVDAELARLNSLVDEYRTQLANTSVANVEAQVQPYLDQIAQLDGDIARLDQQAANYETRITQLATDNSAIESLKAQIADIEETIVVTTNKLQSREADKIREGQAVIGVTDDGLFGSNTRRALTAWVEAQQARIAQLQSQETELRTQAQTTVNNERTRLTNLVASLRGEQTQAIQQRKQGLLDTIDRIRNDAAGSLQSTRDGIQAKIDAILQTDIPANREARRTAQDAITQLRNAQDPKIEAARAEIERIRSLAEDEIAQAQAVIERLRAEIQVGTNTSVTAIEDEQNARISEATAEIERITEAKYALQAEVRKLEAEVGPVKYIAEFVYGTEADRNLLEEAVRWVILTIIFVFDPLAVMLLIAAQYTFEWNRKPSRETQDLDVLTEEMLEDIEREETEQAETFEEDAKVETQDVESVGAEEEQESVEIAPEDNSQDTSAQESILPELEQVIQGDKWTPTKNRFFWKDEHDEVVAKKQMSDVVNPKPDNKTVDKE